eukprot:CAMPEP_0197037026 /NCGR_PEP_ID=MMETSP1384-20130603/14342_1 /TAXON_ID=29189 /ORGANISM="Ammonia sp." /LENGTH=319 /DNA_ID=CAMNT_0042467273 /DNA_START=18 /DNA_END=974 /DNA_ORIENTATION=+
MVEANADTLVSLLTIVALLASLSSAIDIDQFLLKIKKPKGILIGLVCQYGILPVTAFFMSYLFSLPPAIAVALVIIGTCPGGAMSNFWCFAFSADLPLSIAMTTCSSLLSFAFIAMNGAIYIPILSKGSTLNIDWLALGLSVAAVLVGILIGVIIAKYHNMKLIKFMGFLGTATMITILIWALVNVSNSNAPLRDSPPLVFAAIVCMNIVALALSFGISLCLKMKRNSAVSVAIEASNQNAALAIAILLLSVDSGYDRDLALNVPVIYMLTNILFVLCFGLILRRSGWLPIDWEDKTITLGKIIQQWREKRKQGESNEE